MVTAITEVKMRLVLTLAALLAPVALTQAVTEAPVTTDDLLRLYDNAVALEVPVPPGATTYSLTVSGTSGARGTSTFLQPGVDTLRVVVLLPDPAVVDPCAAEEAEATIVAIPIGPDRTHFHNSIEACVPHPPKAQITGGARFVLEGAASAPRLDARWAPQLLELPLTPRMIHTERSRTDR